MKTTKTLFLAALVFSFSACTTEPGPSGSHDGAITADGGPTGDSKIGGTDAVSADGQTDKDTDSSVDSSTDGGSTDIVAPLTCPGASQTTAQTEVFDFPEPRVEKDCVQPLAAKFFAKLYAGKDKLNFLADDQKVDCALATCQLFPQIWSSKYKPGTEYHNDYSNDFRYLTATKEDLAELTGFPILSLYNEKNGTTYSYAAVSVMTCDDTKCEGRSVKEVIQNATFWYEFKLYEQNGQITLELTHRQGNDGGEGSTRIYWLNKI